MLNLKVGIVYNQRSEQIIGDHVLKADNFYCRFRGLLGHPCLKPGEGLWLAPCQQIHMIGMHFALSIWFLDKSGIICDILDDFKPFKISPRRKDALSVLEFPSSWAKVTDTRIGDTLSWIALQ